MRVEQTIERELRCPKCHKFLAAVTECTGSIAMRFRCPRCKERPTLTVRTHSIKVATEPDSAQAQLHAVPS